ncbi:MAG: glycosyltransferase family 4 protein [Anaerolineae bacterium]
MSERKSLVGLDASRAVSAAPTGTEAYSFHLLQRLVPLLREESRVRLYLRESPEALLAESVASLTGAAPLTEVAALTRVAPLVEGAEVRVIPFPRMWTHVRLSWEMMTRPPDLLFVPAHVLPLIGPRRTLVTVHDLGYRFFPEAHPLRQRLYLELSTRWSAWKASHVLADSVATRDALMRAYGTPPEKISVVYPGYDPDLHPETDQGRLREVRQRYGLPMTGGYILFIGRIQPRKNLVRLIEAFGRIAAADLDVHLVLAGPTGWLSEPITEAVADLGLGSRVSFPGFVEAEDKAALISGARVFAYPSLYEGFGFPVLEAQACGTPLLTSTTSSLPEVAGDGGLLVDPEDTDAIAAGLRRLLEDEALRERLTALGFENLKRFSWQRAAQQVHALIEGLLHGR